MLVGVLILAGAQNTSIVGANGVLNRVAEDGVLTSWFQKPHNRFGTSYRIINLIVGMQLLTIFLSLGNVYVLAALYAFGVIWSFAMKSLAVLVLRFTEPGNRRVEGTGQSPYRQDGDPNRIDGDLGRLVYYGGREPVHQVSGHDCRGDFQRSIFYDLYRYLSTMFIKSAMENRNNSTSSGFTATRN